MFELFIQFLHVKLSNYHKNKSLLAANDLKSKRKDKHSSFYKVLIYVSQAGKIYPDI